MTVWFDVEDLFDYARAGHKRVSGIQRLTIEIYRAAVKLGGVGFVRHGTGRDVFRIVEWDEIARQFGDGSTGGLTLADDAPTGGSAAGAPPRSVMRRLARRTAGLMPLRVRKPLVLASVMQVQAAGQLVLFAAGLGAHAARSVARRGRHELRGPAQAARALLRMPSRGPAAGLSFEDLARPGDTLLVLGSPWFRHGYSKIARWLRDERRMPFGVLLCDLVPVRRPEWCDDGVRRTFQAWYSDVLPLCDLVLAISRYTAADVEAYAAELGVRLPRPVRVLPIGTGFGPAPAPPPFHDAPIGGPPAAARHGEAGRPLPHPGSYVLFVSTIEARKNHALIVDVWRRLLRDVRAGLRPAGSVPDLVFAGRVGWLVADLMQQLDNSGWLGGRIRLFQGPSDAELQALYDGCLFTVFPSLDEGWGLPVTESLARGAPCLCSDAASLPESGGGLCRYFDPENVGAAFQAVSAVLDDRPGLLAWRDQVRREFRPTPWADTARAVLEEAAAATGG